MRILIANTDCKFGGVTTFMLALQAALRERGHACDLFFFQDGPMRPHLSGDSAAHFGTLADLLTLIDRERFDIVQANNIDWSTGVSAVRALGAKLLLTAHKVRSPVYTHGWTTRDCDGFISVSRWIRDELQPFTDVPIQAVFNGVDTRVFHPRPQKHTSPPILAWVGRGGAEVKRLEAFAAIAPALRAAGLRIWVIDPQGVEAFAVKHAEAARSLRAAAERWEGIATAAMPDIYREVAASLGCVISTSSREGLGLALIEAQACGCVVIGPDVRGVNECVSPDHGGVLYRPDTPQDELAALVLSVLKNSDGMLERQRKAVAHMQASFSLDHMVTTYLTIYKEAPYAPTGGPLVRLNARLQFSPLRRDGPYVQWRWGVGKRQYDVSKELAAAGEWPLAAAAARASWRAAPTIYAKPARLRHLLRTQWSGGFRMGTRRSPIPNRRGSEPI